jgi:light-regulated signal transduction histidine kinase (bacteriophytochrome)
MPTDKNKTKKCMNSVCKKQLEATKKKQEEFIKKFAQAKKDFETKMKHSNTLTKEELEEAKIEAAEFKRTENEIKRSKNKTYKNTQYAKAMKTCGNLYCNPGCKGTMFEPGKGLSKTFRKNVSKNFRIKGKPNPKIIALFEEERKSLFGNKDNILRDSFYEKFSENEVEKLKQTGFMSYCGRKPRT